MFFFSSIRINVPSAQTAQNAQNNYNFNNALIRGKQEILQIIEKLIDNQAQDIYELLADVRFLQHTHFDKHFFNF